MKVKCELVNPDGTPFVTDRYVHYTKFKVRCVEVCYSNDPKNPEIYEMIFVLEPSPGEGNEND